MERKYMHYIRNSICIHANHVREYQSQSWNKFLSLRSLQRSLIQTATLCEYTPRCQFTPKNLYLKKERSEKKSGHAIVSRMHQLVSGEPVKWSAVPPTVQVIFLIVETMVCLAFLSDDSFLSYDLISWLWWFEPSYALRLSNISNFPLL